MRIVTKQFVISEIILHLVMQRVILTDSNKTIDLYRYMVILFFFRILYYFNRLSFIFTIEAQFSTITGQIEGSIL